MKAVEGHDRMCPVPGRFAVWKCTSCGLHHTEPKLSAAAMAPFYGPAYSVYNAPYVEMLTERGKSLRPARGLKRMLLDRLGGIEHEWLTRRGWRSCLQRWAFWPLRRKVGLVLPFAHTPGAVLDVGCGTGAMLMSAFSRGWACHGIEMSRASSGHLSENGIAQMQHCLFEDAVLGDSSLDVVIMSHVLEHMADPCAALCRISRALRPGGLLMMRLPCVTKEAGLLGTYWTGWDMPRHYYHFERRTIRRMLERSGFEVLSLSGQALPNDGVWAVKWFLADHARTRRLAGNVSVESRLWRALLWPFGAAMKATGQSGRIEIIARACP